MAEVQVRVKHNIATYDLVLSQEESLGTLAQKLMDLTGEYWYHRTVKVHEYIIFVRFRFRSASVWSEDDLQWQTTEHRGWMAGEDYRGGNIDYVLKISGIC